MKSFVAAGEFLFNPNLLAYALVERDSEGIHLRLGFTGQDSPSRCEVRLDGLDARAVLGWLRANADFPVQGDFPAGQGLPSVRQSELLPELVSGCGLGLSVMSGRTR